MYVLFEIPFVHRLSRSCKRFPVFFPAGAVLFPYSMAIEAAEEYGFAGNLVAGANIAGFKKVAQAMMAHGLV